jgi:hypothetical protein
MAAASSAGTSTGLARGAIGLREVLFQSVTSMAPAGAVALSIAVGATYAGGALPLAVLLALVACMLVASSIGQLAKHLPSAGSVYTYPAEAIHPSVGFLVGWGYSLVEALIGPLTMVIFGYLIASVTQSEFNWPFTATWVAFMIAAALVIALLNFRGVQLSARTGTILGTFEVVVFVVLAVWLIVKAGSGNTGAVFTLHFANIKGFSGIATGSIYTILAFIGFEASAPLAEEARNPRRTIQVAVVTSCLAIGIFYVLTTYAGDVFFGPHRFVTFGSLNGGSPWIGLARSVWGVGWVVVFLAIVNSTFANGNAGTLATTRTWFAVRGRSPPVRGDAGHRPAARHPLRPGHRLRVPRHDPHRRHDCHLHGVQPVVHHVLPAAAALRVQLAAAPGGAGPRHPRVHPGRVHRPRYRQVGLQIRRAAVLPVERYGPRHRCLVPDRRRRAALPLRTASLAAAGDEAGLR